MNALTRSRPSFEARPTTPALPAAAATGFGDIVPMAIGLVPYALAIGASAAANGLSAVEMLAGAWLLLAGAAQLAAINLIGSDADVWLAVSTTAIINLRFVLYGAGVARWFAASSPWRRMALAIPVIDQTFLLCEQRFDDEHDQPWRIRYYLTMTATLIGVFTVGQIAGYAVGAGLPPGLGLHLAAPLVFVGMLARSLSGPASSPNHRRVALVAAAALVAVSGLPVAWLSSIALPIAIAAGIAAAGGSEPRGTERGTER